MYALKFLSSEDFNYLNKNFHLNPLIIYEEESYYLSSFYLIAVSLFLQIFIYTRAYLNAKGLAVI